MQRVCILLGLSAAFVLWQPGAALSCGRVEAAATAIPKCRLHRPAVRWVRAPRAPVVVNLPPELEKLRDQVKADADRAERARDEARQAQNETAAVRTEAVTAGATSAAAAEVAKGAATAANAASAAAVAASTDAKNESNGAQAAAAISRQAQQAAEAAAKQADEAKAGAEAGATKADGAKAGAEAAATKADEKVQAAERASVAAGLSADHAKTSEQASAQAKAEANEAAIKANEYAHAAQSASEAASTAAQASRTSEQGAAQARVGLDEASQRASNAMTAAARSEAAVRDIAAEARRLLTEARLELDLVKKARNDLRTEQAVGLELLIKRGLDDFLAADVKDPTRRGAAVEFDRKLFLRDMFPELWAWFQESRSNQWEVDDRQVKILNYGSLQWKDRSLLMGFFQVDIKLRNPNAGERRENCFVIAFLRDDEFRIMREPWTTTCENRETAIQKRIEQTGVHLLWERQPPKLTGIPQN
jgi:hypothetical protein